MSRRTGLRVGILLSLVLFAWLCGMLAQSMKNF